MAYQPHLRVVAEGTLGGISSATAPERWSITLAYGRTSGTSVQIGQAHVDDLAADLRAFWLRPASHICPHARLTRVKAAPIGTDGRYSGPPIIANMAETVAGGTGTYSPPFQAAVAVTLLTDNGLSRVKGRFYLPLPDTAPAAGDGILPASYATDVASSVGTLIDALNNQPGVDFDDAQLVVASNGRTAPAMAGGNFPVSHIKVGRVIDTIRSRRTSLPETYSTLVAVSNASG